MSDPNPPLPPTTPAPQTPPTATPTAPTTFTVGSTVVAPSSAEIAYPLREDHFQMLCEGEASVDRAGRDLSLGLFVGVLVGIAGIVATTDWKNIWAPDRRTPFIWSMGILLFIAAGSLVGIIVCWIRLWRTSKNSTYSRLKARIEAFFKGNQSGE